jgi:hypothetical protein
MFCGIAPPLNASVRRSPDVVARFRHQSHRAGSEGPCCALGVGSGRCSVVLRRSIVQVSPGLERRCLCPARRRCIWAGSYVLCVPVDTLPQMCDTLGMGLNVKRPSEPLDAIAVEFQGMPEVWAPRWPIAMRPSNYAFERTVNRHLVRAASAARHHALSARSRAHRAAAQRER